MVGKNDPQFSNHWKKQNPVPAMSNFSRFRWLGIFVLMAAYAFVFQGSRGLSNRDEGRYTTVALELLKSGDPWTLRLNDEWLHYSKPPLTYYAIASGMAVLGRHEWAVRAPYAIAFILLFYAVYGIGRLVLPGRAWIPALVFATSFMPYAAANAVSTDFLLTLWETMAVLAFLQSRRAPGEKPRAVFLAMMWASFGLAFLTKGPPGLLPLLVIGVFAGWTGGGRGVRRLFTGSGLFLFFLFGLAWYIVLSVKNPGLMKSWFDQEVVGRVSSNAHNRNAQWYYAFIIYVPTLLLGMLPWTGWTVAGAKRFCCAHRWSFWKSMRDEKPDTLFLLLWVAVPLLVFCLIPSKLPLYVLPLFVPLSMLTAASLGEDFFESRWKRWAVGVWVLLLIGVRGLTSVVDYDHADTRRFAVEIRERHPDPIAEVVFVGGKPWYGLSFYLDAEIERVEFDPGHPPEAFGKPSEDLEEELRDAEPDTLFVVSSTQEPQLDALARSMGQQCHAVGHYRDMALVRISPIIQ